MVYLDKLWRHVRVRALEIQRQPGSSMRICRCALRVLRDELSRGVEPRPRGLRRATAR